MPVLPVVKTPPYGSEGPHSAFRVAGAFATRDERVEVFLMGDAVDAAHAGRGCGASCTTRGLTGAELVAHARVTSIHHPAEATMRSERALPF